jgi:hypothetical protein
MLALGMSVGAMVMVGASAPAAADSPPVAPDVFLSVGLNPIFVGGPADLVSGVTDSNNPSTPYTVTFTSTPAHAQVFTPLGTDGSFRYQPQAGFVGLDPFTFTVTDSSNPPQTSNQATAYLEDGFFIMTSQADMDAHPAQRGVPYSFQMQAPGAGAYPEYWGKVMGTGKLPPGLRLISKTGIITGTPRPCPRVLRPCSTTLYTLEFRVRDSSRPHLFRYATLTVTLLP